VEKVMRGTIEAMIADREAIANDPEGYLRRQREQLDRLLGQEP
jgi:hypothetical protein